MSAPPTCSKHGAILMSEWSHEFKSLWSFCPQCRAEQRVKEEVAEAEVMKKAA